MPHNPRRDKSPRVPTEPILTDELITEGMARAVALRCHHALDPAFVTSHPYLDYEAIEATERYRRHSSSNPMRRTFGAAPDPSWWIGSISGAERWLNTTGNVWLTIASGQVHLRYERHHRDAEDPYR